MLLKNLKRKNPLRKFIKSKKLGMTVKIKNGYYAGCLGLIMSYVPEFESHYKTYPEGYMVFTGNATRLPKSLHFYEEKNLEFYR